MNILGRYKRGRVHGFLVEFEDGSRQWFVGEIEIEEKECGHFPLKSRRLIIDMESDGPPIKPIMERHLNRRS